MEVEEWQTELLAALQLVQQQGAALGARLRVRRAQVHQVGAVGDHHVTRVAVRLGMVNIQGHHDTARPA